MMESGKAGFELEHDHSFAHATFSGTAATRVAVRNRDFLCPQTKRRLITLLGQLPMEAPKNPLRKPVLWGPLGKLPSERKRKETSVASDSLRAMIREPLSEPRRKVPTGRRRGAKCDSSQSQECLNVCGALKEKRHNLNWNISKQ